MSKIVNARVPEDLANDLEAVAAYDRVAVSDLVREGLQKVLESRRADPEFKQRVAAWADRTNRMLADKGEFEAAAGYDVRATAEQTLGSPVAEGR